MSDDPVTVRINLTDTVRRAVVEVVEERAAEILATASDRMDAEATARLNRGHDVEHIAGWREAARWQREQAVQP